MKPLGGKRDGSGRKAIDSQGTIVTTVRLTAEQRATFDLLGGPPWLRDTLQAFIEPPAPQGAKPRAGLEPQS